MSQYQEMEQTVYNSLFTLIKDTSVLRDYAAAAILIVQVRPATDCAAQCARACPVGRLPVAICCGAAGQPAGSGTAARACGACLHCI